MLNAAMINTTMNLCVNSTLQSGMQLRRVWWQSYLRIVSINQQRYPVDDLQIQMHKHGRTLFRRQNQTVMKIIQ